MPRKRKTIIRDGDEKLAKCWVRCGKRKYRHRLRVAKAERAKRIVKQKLNVMIMLCKIDKVRRKTSISGLRKFLNSWNMLSSVDFEFM